MLVLVIVAIAALVIGALASGLITHAIATVKADLQLESERLHSLFASGTHFLHQRIDALTAGLAYPPPAAEPPPVVEPASQANEPSAAAPAATAEVPATAPPVVEHAPLDPTVPACATCGQPQ